MGKWRCAAGDASILPDTAAVRRFATAMGEDLLRPKHYGKYFCHRRCSSVRCRKPRRGAALTATEPWALMTTAEGEFILSVHGPALRSYPRWMVPCIVMPGRSSSRPPSADDGHAGQKRGERGGAEGVAVWDESAICFSPRENAAKKRDSRQLNCGTLTRAG